MNNELIAEVSPKTKVECTILTEHDGTVAGSIQVDGEVTARVVIAGMICLAKQRTAFVNFTFDGVSQQAAWTSNTETLLALHERMRRELKAESDRKICVHPEVNERANGIFADGYTDRDGLPVEDVFAYRFRAAVYGAAARDWPKDKLAAWVRTFSTDAMLAIANAAANRYHSQLNHPWEGSVPDDLPEDSKLSYVELSHPDRGLVGRAMMCLSSGKIFNVLPMGGASADTIDEADEVVGQVSGQRAGIRFEGNGRFQVLRVERLKLFGGTTCYKATDGKEQQAMPQQDSTQSELAAEFARMATVAPTWTAAQQRESVIATFSFKWGMPKDEVIEEVDSFLKQHGQNVLGNRATTNVPVLFERDPQTGEATGTVKPFCSVKCRHESERKQVTGDPQTIRGTSSINDFGFDPQCEECGVDISPRPIAVAQVVTSAAQANLEMQKELINAIEHLQKEIRAHLKMNVKKHYSLMVADAQATKVIHKARAGLSPADANA